MDRFVAPPYAPEGQVLNGLIERLDLPAPDRAAIVREARDIVEAVRRKGAPGLLDAFLVRYGLASEEGLALMSLAEALLRVPDQATVDTLIADKLGHGDWSAGGAAPRASLNLLSHALNLTTGVLAPDSGALAPLRGAIRRLGEPVIRAAIRQAMGWLGSQFVFGETIEQAERLAPAIEKSGYRFSYDMLGEAARTAADADRYADAYAHAIATLARRAKSSAVRDNPGISIKLSALHPRYEFAKQDRVMRELVATTRTLARAAAAAGIGFNIDAEEQARLPISLEVIAAVQADDRLRGWDGFGVVVQAYGRRAMGVLDHLEELAGSLDRRIMVRLVKGAYWDTEIKLAQLGGFPSFPVLTRKAATDVSYMACARKLLASERIYPQFATHNAHSAAAVLHLARAAGRGTGQFEFQRLHGMGKELHDVLHTRVPGLITRIYAPVGSHADLLPYLVRRLLENGAGASFVHQIADPDVPVEQIIRDPLAAVEALGGDVANPAVAAPADVYLPLRANSRGFDLADPAAARELDRERAVFRPWRWQAAPMVAGPRLARPSRPVNSPADPSDIVGDLEEANADDIETAIAAAVSGAVAWAATPAPKRGDVLRRAADLYEAHAAEFIALLNREGGRTLPDAIGELREACDYLRFYAGEGERLASPGLSARGIIACISPWNFPLAIFTGQIAGALAGGNAVIAKPAEATPLIAARAVGLLLEAGVPPAALQLLPGSGSVVGAALGRDKRIAGIAFTGSLPTARRIERAMADSLAPDAPLVAETGGVNAMIVDSTALPEQAVRDIIASAFQSAGQRCSALRVLYLQDEIFDRTLAMLKGAMDELTLGDPWLLSTDIGPVIDGAARQRLDAYVADRHAEGRLLHRLASPPAGHFVAPALVEVTGMTDIPGEVFGPILHVARFRLAALDRVVAEINAAGFGLTFAIHSRLASRIGDVSTAIHAGNIYINRNQIGAVVASQPFGGEGLSGTGPKAGGHRYVGRFMKPAGVPPGDRCPPAPEIGIAQVTEGISRAAAGLVSRPGEAERYPGPAGEANELRLFPRGLVLCLGPTVGDLRQQVDMARRHGNAVLAIAPEPADLGVLTLVGRLAPQHLSDLPGVAAVVSFAESGELGDIRRALAAREGAIIPLVTRRGDDWRLALERHFCTDLTAAGGDVHLIASASA